MLLGDFNVYICCGKDTFSYEIAHLIELFGLVQWEKSPTHKLGHLLDLVLTQNLQIEDFFRSYAYNFKDFYWYSTCSLGQVFVLVKENKYRNKRRFLSVCKPLMLESLLLHLGVDEHWTLLRSICVDTLECIAPLRLRKQKVKGNPWLNESTCSLRRLCRQAERRWKKSKLQVHYEALRDSLLKFQKAVREAKIPTFPILLGLRPLTRNYCSLL